MAPLLQACCHCCAGWSLHRQACLFTADAGEWCWAQGWQILSSSKCLSAESVVRQVSLMSLEIADTLQGG